MWMSNQQIFTKVKRHLLKQKSRAWNGGCQYRTPDDKKCAVGCLIPKKLYKPEIEGLAIGNWSDSEGATDEENKKLTDKENLLFKILRKLGIRQQNHRLLSALQELHDTTEVWTWEDGLKDIAKKFRLRY